MTAHMSKTSRSDQVRRRRLQQTQCRFDTVSRTGSLRTGPLISRPRTSTPPATTAARLRPGGLRRRGGFINDLLPASWGLDIRLPALPLPRGWRLMSIALIVLLGGMLARLLLDPAMYISTINLGGAAFVPGQEIYARSGIAGQHIFWVDPVEVERNIAAVPGIAAVSVTVEWPSTVTIAVVERIPVVLWIENDDRWWVDADGAQFKARAELAGLLPITVDDPANRAGIKGGDAGYVPVEAVAGALQLRQLRPNIELLHYDALRGLSYQDGRGWRGYFGVGTDMPQKLAVYEGLVADLLARGIQPKLISVESAQAPYYQK